MRLSRVDPKSDGPVFEARLVGTIYLWRDNPVANDAPLFSITLRDNGELVVRSMNTRMTVAPEAANTVTLR